MSYAVKRNALPVLKTGECIYEQYLAAPTFNLVTLLLQTSQKCKLKL